MKELEDRIKRYDPERGLRFWAWLLYCFKQFCSKKGGKLGPDDVVVVPLPPDVDTPSGGKIEVELPDKDQSGTPEKRYLRIKFLEDLSECLGKMDTRKAQVFVLREIDDLSEQETADRLNIPIGTVKGWLNRAKRILRLCLRGKGWDKGGLES